ncbi:MAG: ABC transporter permease [Acidobacteriota bacterium]
MDRLRQTLRRLRKTPGFTFLAVLTVAVGLGANVAIFAVVDAVLIRPLPYPDSQRLVAVDHAAPGLGLEILRQSERLFLHYREAAESYEHIALIDQESVSLGTADGRAMPRRLTAAQITPGGLEMMRVTPTAGRFFRGEEGRPGAAPTVVLGDSLWRRDFGAEPDTVGRLVTIDGVEHEVIGIVPDLDFPDPEVRLWLPRVIDPETARLTAFGSFGLARLADGVTLEQANAEADRLVRPLAATFPDDDAAKILDNADFDAKVIPLRDIVVGDLGTALWILLGTVAFVLLIACANVANLFLVRTERRRRESAIRTALGAGRRELALDGLFESLALGLAGGIVGLGLATAAIELLHAFGPQELPRLHEVTIDGRIAAFALLLSVVAGLLFGLVPIVRSRVRQLATTLKDGGRSATIGHGGRLLRHSLVVGQVAMALTLLVGAGLMVRSFERLTRVDPGFDSDPRALTFSLALPQTTYPDDEAAARFVSALVDEMESLPGIDEAGTTTSVPLGGHGNARGHEIEGRPLAEGEPPPLFRVELISDGYLEAVGARLLAGRALTRAETESRAPVCLVSASLAAKHFPDGDALGQRISNNIGDGDSWSEIVGIVGNIHSQGLDEVAPDTVYYPLLPVAAGDWEARSIDVVLRHRGTTESMIPTVRDRVWGLDNNLPLTAPRTLDELVRNARARMAFTVLLLLIAAGVAIALGAIGTYGVLSSLVTERRGEIGIRIALGAPLERVAGAVVQQGLRLAALGAVVGLAAAAGLTRALQSILFEIAPLDPVTFAVVPCVLLLIVLVATAGPALRAARVDPMEVLRGD